MGLLDRIQQHADGAAPRASADRPTAVPATQPSLAARMGGALANPWPAWEAAAPVDHVTAALRQLPVSAVPTQGTCVVAGCPATLVVACSYEDRRGERCAAATCAQHRREVADRPYCRRHGAVAETLRLAAARGHQMEAPDLRDRSLSLLRWMSQELDGPVSDCLYRCSRGRLNVLDDPQVIHVRADRTRSLPAAWERVWTLTEPAGPVMRATLRVEASRPETVVWVVDHTVLGAAIPPWIRHRMAGEPEPAPEVDAVERATFREELVAGLVAHIEAHPPGAAAGEGVSG